MRGTVMSYYEDSSCLRGASSGRSQAPESSGAGGVWSQPTCACFPGSQG